MVRLNKYLKIFVTMMSVFLLYSCEEEEQKSELYLKDKHHIEQAYIDNVEFSRRALLWHKDGYTLNPVCENYMFNELPDCLSVYSINVFAGYASYFDDEHKLHRAIPKPTNEWLEVEVGSISYSADSLKCVALVTVRDKSPLFTKGRKKDINQYDGYAIIGIRDDKNKSFKIYPEGFLELWDCPSKSLAIWELKAGYYNLKGKYTPQSGVKYSYGINDPRFFETAHEFSWIDSLGMYWCETDMWGGDRIPYVFYSNQDSTIDKHLFVE